MYAPFAYVTLKMGGMEPFRRQRWFYDEEKGQWVESGALVLMASLGA